jgi:two-component system OmpR family sensor kinase
VVVTGLPTADVDQLVQSLVITEVLLLLLALLAAGGIGSVLVRRQLRPLREVAATAHAVSELPLASGAITLDERVPAHLTDVRTEVGQVGAALNTMLDHVGSSLEARHRSEQQVRQFVADASHELRTPLTTIAGYTELARSHPDDKAAADTALAKVEEESGRMTALVEDLLLLARLDSGRPLASEPVDLTRLLVEAVSDARVLAPDHLWRLSLPESSVEVIGDEQRLHQVVTNLLANARKYTPAGTTITVSAHPGGFSVHDDGPGFPPDLVPHAFERFARGDAARVRAGRAGGYGLGLSLVDAIVTAHGGRVSLRSVPGDTTVTVDLSPSAG